MPETFGSTKKVVRLFKLVSSLNESMDDVGLHESFEPSSTVEPSLPKAVGCCCERLRSASGSYASLRPASGITGIRILLNTP